MQNQDDVKILVKKADGSYVHLSLSEVKKKQRQSAVPASGTTKQESPWVGDKLQTTTEAKKSEVRISTPMPPESLRVEPKPAQQAHVAEEKFVKPIVVPVKEVKKIEIPTQKVEKKSEQIFPKVSEANVPAIRKSSSLAVNVSKDDAKSLLEEPIPGVGRGMPLTSENREKQIDAVIQSLSFRPATGNTSRLRTIIQLFLKDVRGETETREILRRPEMEGGMGLSVGQTEEVVNKTKTSGAKTAASASTPPPLKTVIPALKAKFDPTESARLEKEIPALRPVSKPMEAVKPTTAVRTEERKFADVQASKAVLNDEITKVTLSEAEPFKIGGGQPKTSMHDVKAPPIELGPVDEIRYFSLVDFRRLSTSPTEAATRFGQKFINLKDESIVLYFEALDAWASSPLHHDYLAVVSEALEKKLPLARVAAGDSRRIQLPEIKAIIQMEKALG
jgi:hypothetical protein